MRCRLAFLALALAGCLAAPAAVAATPYEDAIALERRGDLDGAAAVLADAKLKGAQAAHREALDAARAAIAAADVYTERKQLDLAESTLAAASARVDAARDVYVRSALQNRLKQVQAARAPPPGSVWDDAWAGLKDTLRSFLEWLLIAAAVLAVVGAVALVGRFMRRRLPPRPGVGVMLEDLSAQTVKRPESGRALGRELSAAIKAVNEAAAAEPVPELDATRDLDGSISLNVRVAGDELAVLQQYTDGENKVKIGPLAVTPRDLIAWLSSTFARPVAHTLRGSLVSSASTTRLDAELHRGGERLATWTSSADGDAGRLEVISDSAHRVLFEVVEKTVTPSWPSMSCYREARARLKARKPAEQREAALIDARGLLERALSFDPANLLARFEYGTVLRKLGANRAADRQYSLVHEQCAQGSSASRKLRRAVGYNRAIALSKIDDREANDEALRLLAELIDGVDADGALAPAARERLLVLFRSAQAAALVWRLEQWRHELDDPQTQAAGNEREELIAEARDWIAQLPPQPDPEGRAIYTHALAVAENAVGRGRHLLGHNGAIEAFDRALTLVAGFGDAHANMASALLRQRARYPDWDVRVEEHLKRALEASPNDRRALYLRGKLCHLLKQIDDARKWWEQSAAAGDDQALLALARLRSDEGTLDGKADAVVLAIRSQARRPAFDDRPEMLVIWTGELARAGKAERAWLVAARKAGMLLDAYLQERGRALPARVQTELAVIESHLAAEAVGGNGAGPAGEPAAEPAVPDRPGD